jgi:hypothetical protein
MREIIPPIDIDKKRDEKALRILMEVIDILGGPRRIIEYRNLTWIPSILKASYAILLKEAGLTHESIARELGVTKSTVEKILRADPEEILRKLSGDEVERGIDDHVAGGLAKLGYKQLRERILSEEIDNYRLAAETLGVEWAVVLMSRIRGLDFPVDKTELLKRLKGIRIYDIPIEDVLESLKYPIKSPRELLKEISKTLKEKR